MTQQFIDFGNFSRKILMNPAVPLQILQLFYRNKERIQATILGKVYSNYIQILQMVPVGLCQQNKIQNIDYREHSRAIDNLKSVYPSMQVLGVAVTDLEPDRNLAILHTFYNSKNKADQLDSEFKAQPILPFPLIVSISTKINEKSKNFDISAYSFNKLFLFCKDLMGLTSFEKLEVTISFGDSDIESMTPLFQAMNDQQKFVPSDDIKELTSKLIKNLEQLKTSCQSSNNNEQLKVKIRRIIDRLKVHHEYNIEQLSYLLDYASLQRVIGKKINQIEGQIKI